MRASEGKNKTHKSVCPSARGQERGNAVQETGAGAAWRRMAPAEYISVGLTLVQTSCLPSLQLVAVGASGLCLPPGCSQSSPFTACCPGQEGGMSVGMSPWPILENDNTTQNLPAVFSLDYAFVKFK